MKFFSTLPLYLALAAAVCAGSTIAVTPGSGGLQNAAWNADTTLGWQFSLSSTISVTDLGFFDADGDGLANDHGIGIWTSVGVLQGSAVVPAGTSAALLDGFRFVAVTPFVLGPGDYAIGAFGAADSTDEFLFALSGSVTMPGLTLGAAVQSPFSETSLAFPSVLRAFASEGYFGANFLAEVDSNIDPIPEPSTLSLLALALGVGYLRRRKG